MGEVLILHLSREDENLWDKLVDLLDENGYKINHIERNDKTIASLKFKDLETKPAKPLLRIGSRRSWRMCEFL